MFCSLKKNLFGRVNTNILNSFPTIPDFQVKSPIDQPRCFDQWKWVPYTGVRLNFDSIEFRPVRSLFYGLCLRFNGFSCWRMTPPETVSYCITTLPKDKIWTHCWIMTLLVHFYSYAEILALSIHLFSPRLHIFAVLWKKEYQRLGNLDGSQFHVDFWPRGIIPRRIVTPVYDSMFNCDSGHDS